MKLNAQMNTHKMQTCTVMSDQPQTEVSINRQMSDWCLSGGLLCLGLCLATMLEISCSTSMTLFLWPINHWLSLHWASFYDFCSKR